MCNDTNFTLPVPIADLISEINEAAAKAHYIGQDVHERYFSYFHEDNPQDRLFIVHEFDRYRVKSLIVMDNIEAIKQALKEIDRLTAKTVP